MPQKIYKTSELYRYIFFELIDVSDSPEIEAELITCHVTGQTKENTIKNNNLNVSAIQTQQAVKIVEGRKNHIPLNYLICSKYFYTSNFFVNKYSLIPRSETEILIELCLHKLGRLNRNKANILEIGTGSGCIFISILKHLIENNNIDVQYNFLITDISRSTLKVAQHNFKEIIRQLPKNFKVELVVSDILPSNLTIKYFDLIVSNPPYIPTQEVTELASEVKQEPLIALDGGKDGLDIYRKIFTKVRHYINYNSSILLEIHPPKLSELENLILTTKFPHPQSLSVHKDLNQLNRVLEINFSDK